MADVHSKETRSYNMSRIRSKDTKPEMLIRRFLHKNGFRYRLHVIDLPGKPDIVLPKYNTVIFVHGCFGMGMRGVNTTLCPKPEQNGGSIRSTEMYLKINFRSNLQVTKAGRLSRYGNVILKRPQLIPL